MSPLAVWLLARSLEVTDAAGHVTTKSIGADGAAAIAKRCEKHTTAAAQGMCGLAYTVVAFRESGYDLFAVSRTDCRSHVDGHIYTVPWGSDCLPGDSHVSFGPFQTGKKPSTWEEAVAIYAPLLERSILTCAEPLALVASGSCTNKAGIAISKARMAEAKRIFAAHPFTLETP